MNNDQIRETLAGYRPELYQDDDPLIADCLRAARADPELSAWLDEQIAFDREITEILSQVLPAQDNCEHLLATRQEHAVVPLTKRRTHRAVWAVAAILLLTTAGLVYHFASSPQRELSPTVHRDGRIFRKEMALFANQSFVLDKLFTHNTESAAWLASEEFPSLTEMPDKLTHYRGMGCKKIAWNEHKVSLICFTNQNNETIHLFVLDRAALNDNPAHEAEFEKELVFHELETKGWLDADTAYLLVGAKPGIKVGNIL